MRLRQSLIFVLLFLSLIAACGSLDEDSADAGGDGGSTELPASADDDDEPSAAGTTGSSVSTGVDASVASTVPAADRTSVAQGSTEPKATEQSSTTDTVGAVLEPGPTGSFRSPSGNILCLMQEDLTSCWIGEKQWSIDQPPDPACADADWGDAIDLSSAEVWWPCYTDFIYDPGADVLDYGDAMVVSGFRCDSARAGVTCLNQTGQGFRLAKSEVVVF